MRIKNNFTLAEILVAMVVFSILLMLMIQFFSGARTLWVANEKRSTIYADASIALDLMTELLHSTYFFIQEDVNPKVNHTPFLIHHEESAPDSSDANHMIVFLSDSMRNLSSGGSLRYLCFQRGNDPSSSVGDDNNNVLYLKVFGDAEGDAFASCMYPFVPYDGGGKGKHDGQLEGENGIRKFLYKRMKSTDFTPTASDLKSNRVKPILRNVVGLKFTPIIVSGVERKKESGDYKENNFYTGIKTNQTLVGIEIELSLMENERKIADWRDSNFNSDFKTQNEYTFRRTVWLGQRALLK